MLILRILKSLIFYKMCKITILILIDYLFFHILKKKKKYKTQIKSWI